MLVALEEYSEILMLDIISHTGLKLVMCKARLWPGLRGLRLCKNLGRAKAASEGLAPAWLGSGRGFWQRGRVIVVVVCGRGEGVVMVVVVVVIWSILE
jgi:hypothetical protein